VETLVFVGRKDSIWCKSESGRVLNLSSPFSDDDDCRSRFEPSSIVVVVSNHLLSYPRSYIGAKWAIFSGLGPS
jgi:hypothetical protein